MKLHHKLLAVLLTLLLTAGVFTQLSINAFANETDTADDNIDPDDTISYVLESAWEGYFSEVPAIASDTSEKTLSEKAADYVVALNDAPMIQLAKELKAYAEANRIAPDYTSSAAAYLSSWLFSLAMAVPLLFIIESLYQTML